MERQECYKLCKTCTHRDMDRERGMICGLTKEYPDFEGTCDLYEEDEKLKKKDYKPGLPQDKIEAHLLEDASLRKMPKSFWWVVGLVLCVGFLVEFFVVDSRKSNLSEATMKFLSFWHIGFFGLTFFALAWMISSFKKAVITGIAAMSMSFIIFYLFAASFENKSILRFLVSFVEVAALLFLISYDRFNAIKKTLIFSVLGAFLYKGLSSFFYLYYVLQDYERLLFRDLEFSENRLLLYHVVDSLVYFILIGVALVLLRFLFKQIYNGRYWGDFKIDIQAKVEDKGVFVLKLVSGYLILILLIMGVQGYAASVLSYHVKPGINGDFAYEKYLYPIWFSTLQLIAILYALFSCLFYYRNLVLGYFVQHGLPVSYMYFFSWFPVLGLVVWLIILTSDAYQDKLSESNRSYKLEKNQSFKWVYLFVVVFYILYKLLTLKKRELEFLDVMASFGAILLLVLYVFNRYGIYVAETLRLVLVFVLLEVIDWNFEYILERSNLMLFLAPFVLAFSYRMLFHPAFHIKDYKITLWKSGTVEHSSLETSE